MVDHLNKWHSRGQNISPPLFACLSAERLEHMCGGLQPGVNGVEGNYSLRNVIEKHPSSGIGVHCFSLQS
jgi:hypothetical protein